MGTTIGRNFIVKIRKKFSKHNAKNFAWKFLTVIKNHQKPEMISLSYDNDHVYLKSKSINFVWFSQHRSYINFDIKLDRVPRYH